MQQLKSPIPKATTVRRAGEGRSAHGYGFRHISSAIPRAKTKLWASISSSALPPQPVAAPPDLALVHQLDAGKCRRLLSTRRVSQRNLCTERSPRIFRDISETPLTPDRILLRPSAGTTAWSRGLPRQTMTTPFLTVPRSTPNIAPASAELRPRKSWRGGRRSTRGPRPRRPWPSQLW